MTDIVERNPWLIVCTDKFETTVAYYRDVMGIPLIDEGVPIIDTQFSRFAQFRLPGSTVIEVVEPIESLRSLYKGVIYSINVQSLVATRQEFETKGVKFISQTFYDRRGWGWIYFQTPEGHIFQLHGPLAIPD